MTDDERREKAAKRQRAWREANRERARETARRNAAVWRIANSERAKGLNEAARQKRIARDPEGERARQREAMRRRAANPKKASEPSARRKVVQARYDKSEKGRASNLRKKAKRRGQPWGKLDYIIRNARTRAKKRSVVFDDRLLELAFEPPVNCPCCGIALDYTCGAGQRPHAPSLDRTVASAGYLIGNVAIICMRCNGVKNEGTAEDHRRIAAYIDSRLQHVGQLPPD